MKVVWTGKAKISFSKILEYLNENRTQKEINNFAAEAQKAIFQIGQNPFMFITSGKKKNIRKGFVNRKVSLFYRIRKRKKEIELLLFWDNRQNPEDLKY